MNTDEWLSVERSVEMTMAQNNSKNGWLLALSLTAGAVAGAVVAYRRIQSQQEGDVSSLMDVAERAARKLDERLDRDRLRASA